MIRKIIYTGIAMLVVLALLGVWMIWGPATAFENDRYNLYIRTGMTYPQVKNLLEKDHVLKNLFFFNLISSRVRYQSNVKAGKYEIRKGVNLLDIIRMLKNGKQEPVNLIITKIRTKESLAALIGRHFECDSATFQEFLQNNDSLSAYGLDSNTALTVLIPDTYTFFWNSTASRIYKKWFAAHQAFWNPERIEQAKKEGLNPATAYILASIVEEETTKAQDKSLIASTYMNRIARGMKLSADPTIKYALKNFELKRIYDKYLEVESPYNTYKNTGLPPGPICTPSRETIDSVLGAPKTNFLYFVAKPDFSGYSNFSESFSQHIEFAKQYQKALDEEKNRKDPA